MTGQYATQSATLQADSVETQQLMGREHVVAKATLVREMVLKGEFLPFEEIQATQLAWNAKPSTISHPRDGDGNFVPASAPSQHETHVSGKLFDIQAKDKELVGKVYVDVERSAQVAEELDRDDPAQKLLNGESIEGSVGYWYERLQMDGEHNGDEFDAVQVNVQPDHYALLPNATGECSIEDGCGVNTGVNVAQTAWQSVRSGIGSVNNALSFSAACGCDNMSKAQELAEKSAFDEETLQEWDESQLDALEESLQEDDDPPNDGQQNSNDNDVDDIASQVTDQVLGAVDERFNEFQEEQTKEERQEHVAHIARYTSKEAEDLEDWDLQQLEAFAEEVTPEQNGVYAGSAGASFEASSDGDDFEIGLNGRHLEGDS